MIVCNIIGGLGNQMFQYACARALSLRLGTQLRLATDMFEGYALHNGFELKRVFGIKSPLATQQDLRSLLGWRHHPKVRHVLGRPQMRALWHRHAVIERGLAHDPTAFGKSPPMYLHGYWQSEKYFADFQTEIRADFAFSPAWREEDLTVLAAMRSGPSASVHVRRGDYLASKNAGSFAICGSGHFLRCMSLLRERVPGVSFFVFSDDPQWARQNIVLAGSEVVHVSHNTGAHSFADMRLMSEAHHHIIANSTFSWWGAWLNPSPEKLVLAPSRWFADGGLSDADLLPGAWLRV